MATLPSFPVFSASDSSIAKLNELSAAVSFLYDCDTRPLWHFHSETTQTLSAGWNLVKFPVNTYDSDGVYYGTGQAKIVTRGYYAVESCVEFEPSDSSINSGAGFLFTAGSSNPHYAENTTVLFGMRAFASYQGGDGDNTLVASDITSMCCYPGDILQAQAYCTKAITLDYNQNTSYTQGRFVPNFTGYWTAYGS